MDNPLLDGNKLNEWGIAWLMPAVKYGTVKKAIWEAEKEMPYSITSDKMRVKFTLIIRSAENENDARETATDSKEGKRLSYIHRQHLSRDGGLRSGPVCREI